MCKFSFVEKNPVGVYFTSLYKVCFENTYRFTGQNVSNAKTLPHIKCKIAFGPHATYLNVIAYHWNIE